jgi:two-component system, NarL family, response regulator YdfI
MAKKNGGALIRVLLSAGSAVRRLALESALKDAPTVRLLGGIYGLNSLAHHVSELQADVVLADLVHNDPQFITSISAMPERIPVVVLVDEPSPDWVGRALQNGVRSLLPRDSSAEEILWAIQTAHSGFVLLDVETTETLARNVRPEFAQFELELDRLTPREIEVLHLLADGAGNKEIAGRLGISDHTVKFHISSILDKLGASTRTEAVTVGIRSGLILL